MTNLIDQASQLLESAGFDVQQVELDGTPARAFENDTLLGFVFAYDTAGELIARWRSDTDGIVKQRQFQLRAAGIKAWNTYVLLLAYKRAGYAEAVALSSIEEDLAGLRKIARAGCMHASDVLRALLPLMPLQSAPVLDAVDSKEEIRQRTTELAPRIVEAFLSAADTHVVLQLLEEESMKVLYVEASGFRGYRDPVRIEFAPGFTIIDGRNGVGKSTIFDAIEFALTGYLSKYQGATAAGQSVADYFWWVGEGDVPKERYVEVGFSGDGEKFIVRRTPFDATDFEVPPALVSALAHPQLAPRAPLEQLCATAIIRDEHIAGLSLDLKETERYALLRQAIGANDADSWIARAHEILAQAKRRSELAQSEVNTLTAELAAAARRIDEIQSSLASESAIAEATGRLWGICKCDSHFGQPDRGRSSSHGCSGNGVGIAFVPARSLAPINERARRTP